MKSYEFSAKNIQDAINKGLEELGVKQEDVNISVLSDGGIFSKAKILITVDDEPEAKIEELIVEKPVINSKKIISEEEIDGQIIHKVEQTVAMEKIKEDFKDVLIEKNTIQKKERTFLPEEEQQIITEQMEEFVKKLIQVIDDKAELLRVEDEEKIMFNIRSEKAGNLIGYRGDGLKAMQTIISQIAQNKNRDCKKIFIDVENYKAKKEQGLIELANRIADKVERTGRYEKMEHLNAFERRIVHTALQERENLDTHSQGIEPNRYLIIEKKR